MNRLIQDLLDVARMQVGRMRADFRPWAPSALVASAIDGARMQAEKQSISLRVAIAPGLPEVRADLDRILQVFSNLLGNALKFTPTGGDIEVSASWARSDGAFVSFAVRDTGPGIPAEHLPHVFDRSCR